MRKFTLLLTIAGLFAIASAQAQTPGTKGNGQVFFTETFGWENPADAKGWTAPAGYYFLDPTDIGYNFVWWNEGFVNRYTQDPPLNSTTKANGCVANFLEKYNEGGLLSVNLDNSIGFPPMDCSSHSSVIVRFQTHFMAYSVAHMWLEVSVDNWVHSAQYNVNFGCGHKDRPLDKPKGEPALYEGNISDVAAGMPNVQMRLHWLDTRLYYWAIDDFTVSEGYNNDLKMNFVEMEWDNADPNNKMAWIYNIPKSQLDGTGGFMNFKSSTLNFGENDQENVYLDVDISKNGNSVFHEMSTPRDVFTLVVDTSNIEKKYSPADYGHYKIDWVFKGKDADDNPADNKREVYFNVTDSVYSRADNSNELGWSYSKERYDEAQVANYGHTVLSIFPIFNDCEVSSISCYIAGGKADALTNYRFVLYYVPLGEDDETPFELLATEMIQLDSADFGTWVTMNLEKDGESEFLKKGDLVYAGLQYDNENEWLVRRNFGLEVGTDNSVKLTASTAIGFYDGNWQSGLDDFIGKRNLMIHLNLNDHGNINDGVDLNPALANLGQNYPNPFKQTTEIAYELTNGSQVSFEVMDLTGRKVMEVNEGMVPAGKHTFTLQTSNLDAGVYFYTLKAGSFVQTKQMVIVE